jgi:hypothetical protein
VWFAAAPHPTKVVMITGRMGRIGVFCSYAREDEAVQRALQDHLAPLRDEKVIDDWYDDRVLPGARWNDQIAAALERSRLVLFIVTPDLLASQYVRDVELPKSLALERANRCQIVPIIARATDWGDSPLASFQALPKNARAIESYSNPTVAYAEIVAGIREVCGRIVDWENPYKRTKVGDWTHYEQTMTLPDGRSMTVEGTAEVVKKTEKEAVVTLELWGNGEFKQQTLTIDLTQPLEDFGNLMKQMGEGVPANAEMRVGPSRYEEEVVTIGGKRYETIKGTREFVIAQRGWEQKGFASTWRCIDVPLDGIVKGTGDMQVMRQNMVLLGFGHGDAGSRKPRVGQSGSGQYSQQPAGPVFQAQAPMALVGPGRWHVRMAMFGVVSDYDLLLHPNGALQGSQMMMGMAVPLQGGWAFYPANNVLALQVVAIMMGMPAAQDVMQMQITGQVGPTLHAVDAMGRQFQLQRIG